MPLKPLENLYIRPQLPIHGLSNRWPFLVLAEVHIWLSSVPLPLLLCPHLELSTQSLLLSLYFLTSRAYLVFGTCLQSVLGTSGSHLNQPIISNHWPRLGRILVSCYALFSPSFTNSIFFSTLLPCLLWFIRFS